MSFTDEDLKRLEEKRDDPQTLRILTTTSKLDYLLYRLKAAEKCADYGCPKHISTIPWDCDWCKFYEAWRKSKGARGDE